MPTPVAPGSVAVVTGCTRGYGRVLARRLADRGVVIVVSGIDLDESQAFAAEIGAAGGRAVAAPGDVTSDADVAALVAAAVDLGGPDLWINNAAFESPGMASVLDVPSEDFLAVQEVNVMGTYRATRAALGVMTPRGRGVIVNITGRGDDLRASRFSTAYAASKAWIRSFSRSVAAETASTGVRVIPFNPGIMITDRMAAEERRQDVGVDDRTQKLFDTVRRALGDPPEVAADALIDFLDREPATLRKELRLITPGRVAKGLGGEAQRAAGDAVSRLKSRTTSG
jgi:NAD(P)-dependent dehydrogenase (short-subunit alcohol dehydrogenase family)